MGEVGEVGGERGDELLVGAGVAGERSARADLCVGGVEFGPYGGGEAVGQYAGFGQCLGPFGEGAVQGVVAAEDQGGQGRQPGVGEGGVSVTMPVGGWRPAAMAAHPAVAVVATEPRAPMNQTPVRWPGLSAPRCELSVGVRPSRAACAVTGCLPGG